MRYIMCQTDVTKFSWQLEVAITNLTALGVSPKDIFVILVDAPDGDIATGSRIANKYHVNVHQYAPDYANWAKYHYIPYVKPWGLYRFFEDHPEEIPYTYMYQDSDVVYRELIDESKLYIDAKHWIGSDTGSYTGLSYIKSKGEELVKLMADKVGVSPDTLEALGDTVPGAQLIFNSPDTEWFKASAIKSQELYKWLTEIEPEYKHKYSEAGNPDEYPIQRWTAQMWTDIWIPADNGVHMGVSPELDFCFATDDMETMNTRKIYHDAGVSSDDKDMFYKGQYDHGKTPFGEDFSFVNKNKASYFYVKAIEKVRN